MAKRWTRQSGRHVASRHARGLGDASETLYAARQPSTRHSMDHSTQRSHPGPQLRSTVYRNKPIGYREVWKHHLAKRMVLGGHRAADSQMRGISTLQASRRVDPSRTLPHFPVFCAHCEVLEYMLHQDLDTNRSFRHEVYVRSGFRWPMHSSNRGVL